MVAAMTALAAGCAQPSSAGVALMVTLPPRPPASDGAPSGDGHHGLIERRAVVGRQRRARQAHGRKRAVLDAQHRNRDVANLGAERPRLRAAGDHDQVLAGNHVGRGGDIGGEGHDEAPALQAVDHDRIAGRQRRRPIGHQDHLQSGRQTVHRRRRVGRVARCTGTRVIRVDRGRARGAPAPRRHQRGGQ